ncbi:MAG: dethiobiotin synthase [Solirubrobacteraceae bacterium]
MRGIFVTGTGTEVGKSVVAASICAALAARGMKVAAFKPVVTGTDDAPDGGWPRDHELLASVASAGQAADDVAPMRFGPPVSPHHAADLADTRIEPRELVDAARGAAEGRDFFVCEGIGGLLVPFTTGYMVRDLAIDLGLPAVVAAQAGLGTINHTLLTLEAARTGGLDVLAVVLTPWPDEPSDLERSNREAIEQLGNVRVCGLPETSPDGLAEAGEALPLDDWLETE